jgi:hypothetical protein
MRESTERSKVVKEESSPQFTNSATHNNSSLPSSLVSSHPSHSNIIGNSQHAPPLTLREIIALRNKVLTDSPAQSPKNATDVLPSLTPSRSASNPADQRQTF